MPFHDDVRGGFPHFLRRDFQRRKRGHRVFRKAMIVEAENGYLVRNADSKFPEGMDRFNRNRQIVGDDGACVLFQQSAEIFFCRAFAVVVSVQRLHPVKRAVFQVCIPAVCDAGMRPEFRRRTDPVAVQISDPCVAKREKMIQGASHVPAVVRHDGGAFSAADSVQDNIGNIRFFQFSDLFRSTHIRDDESRGFPRRQTVDRFCFP